MTANESGDAKHAPLQPHVADKLLDLLSTDDGFRAAFKADPAAALAQIGHPGAGQHAGKTSIAEGETFYCMTADQLAPKEEIMQAREELKSYLTSYTDHQVIFCFEAGKITSTLRSK
ncbi:MAG: NHLP-related RiPP peptide [Lysobacter sp.]